ncbi:related to oxidoreductase, 2OG-Fe(II) oxygenase family family [Rhynchosporium agropyri]|uniref:Related to oxidoreductase, 2OG-Fe(II) oxygenase family family n=1 Tax=Rhynchosporium agropyri TaxID=914238 RepID=A0A1E1KYU3_9HELO|nr:related to oxidoreductase, 2OG-Fe(II) oxygenase family family [Rhynchosporium agropyri]
MFGYIAGLLPLCFFVLLPVSNILFGTSHRPSKSDFQFNGSFIAANEPLKCPPHNYKTHILSQEPLVIYIQNFLSSDESAHLLRTSEEKYEPSTVTSGAERSIKTNVRHSEVALLDRDDIIRCIEHRARSFQGWRPDLHIERLRSQRYGVGGHYTHHYDWSGASRDADRVSTFMVYVDAECEGGGTEFPRMIMPNVADGKWCEFLECEEDNKDANEKKRRLGVTFKPKKGNAVFWENLRPDGRGYEETWHAGLPVKSGWKVGLNIWSWGPARRSESG